MGAFGPPPRLMRRRLLSRDPVTGITRWFIEEGGAGYVQTVQSDRVLHRNQDERKARDCRTRYGEGLTHVARIPLVVVDDLMRTGRFFDKDAMRKWLNASENRQYRTREGRV